MKVSANNYDFPSKVKDEFWVYAHVLKPCKHLRKYKNEEIGKWLVLVDIRELDITWQKIKNATEDGQLGIQAKSATAWSSRLATSENEKVICIYTYNWKDQADVFRVEAAIRKLGVEQTLFYKTNEDTRKCLYKAKGSA